MKNTKHGAFIRSNPVDILKEANLALSGIGHGIETFSLHEYVMQSVFIRMTGYQEQKLKCILWDVATFDYGFRYEITRKPGVEYSNYKDKNALYASICNILQKKSRGMEVVNDDKKRSIFRSAFNDIENAFLDSNILKFMERNFNEFRSIKNEFKYSDIASCKNNILAEVNGRLSMKKVYEEQIYVHRNRIAHNTGSYQNNLPSLMSLSDAGKQHENYVLWFYIILIIDRVFVELYNKFMDSLEGFA